MQMAGPRTRAERLAMASLTGWKRTTCTAGAESCERMEPMGRRVCGGSAPNELPPVRVQVPALVLAAPPALWLASIVQWPCAPLLPAPVLHAARRWAPPSSCCRLRVVRSSC